ncbi:hypothetical protein BGX27_006060 [Mortierella sp. AM989]|nr:hypothetical protein BGX27_006060 [Mortierella sp. AM989]
MVKSSSSAPYCFVSGQTDIAELATSSKYVLVIRQQPQRAKVCGVKERDRRTIDPPPIVQIKLADPTSDRNKDYLQSPYLFMCCNIVHANDPNGEIVAPAHRALAGTVVSSLNRLKDVDNSDGGFFVFGDMSVRIEGRFCLRFTLFELIEGQVVHVMTTLSNPMIAHPSKTFPGMSESTFLSRSFSDQGVRIRIRKDHHVKPKMPLASESINGSMDSPSSSCHEAEHSDNDADMQQSHRHSRPSVHDMYSRCAHSPTRHVAIASRPKELEARYSSEPYDRSPPSSPHSFVVQDPTPSRSHNTYMGDDVPRQPYHITGRPCSHQEHAASGAYPRSYSNYHSRSPRAHPYSAEGRRPSSSSSSAYSREHGYYREVSPSYSYTSSSVYNPAHPPQYQSFAPMHAGHHGFPSALLSDQEMEYAPAHSRSNGRTQAYHSRTPSMSSQHSDGNFSPPHPFSPTEPQMSKAQSPMSPVVSLPLILPSLSRGNFGDKIQLPSIHALSTHSPIMASAHSETGYGYHY